MTFCAWSRRAARGSALAGWRRDLGPRNAERRANVPGKAVCCRAELAIPCIPWTVVVHGRGQQWVVCGRRRQRSYSNDNNDEFCLLRLLGSLNFFRFFLSSFFVLSFSFSPFLASPSVVSASYGPPAPSPSFAFFAGLMMASSAPAEIRGGEQYGRQWLRAIDSDLMLWTLAGEGVY